MIEKLKIPEKFIRNTAILLLAVLIVGIGFAAWKRRAVPKVDPNAYQGVFLNNNQQYFGHLRNIGTRYPYLTDIYYLQTQAVATEPKSDQEPQTSAPPQPQF